ncbi:unnamed protein product [Schistosoma curassoni]|nr:unnamed protein product [Schistosoma intercalatum]CAH8525666.1 unnamed protein product [Schistosoma curassoni]
MKYQDMVIKRNNIEFEKLAQWKRYSNYLNNSTVRTEKEKRWSSNKYLINSSQDFVGKNNEDSQESLQARRNKLLQLLENDAENEKNLLKAYGEYSKSKSAMLIRSTALKKERDSEKEKMAETLLMEHFKKNNSDVRDMLRAAGQNEIADHWNDQINERNKLKHSENIGQIVSDEMQSDIKMYEDKHNVEIELKRLQDKEKHLEYLQKQLCELNNRETEAKRLVEKEKDLIKQLAKIDQLEHERRIIEEKCQRELYGRALLHQHQTALRRRSLSVQNELKADLDWLNQLTEQENFDYEADIERRQKEKENILAIQKLVEYELQKEQIRELELNELEVYEASKLWAKREEEWRNETAIRQKLLHEVIEDRRKQISDQLTAIQQFQHDELISREELLEKIENINLYDKLEEATRHDQVNEQCCQLNNQLADKIKSNQFIENELKADLEAQQKAELAYEVMLRKEAENLHLKEKQLRNLTFYKSSNGYSTTTTKK